MYKYIYVKELYYYTYKIKNISKKMLNKYFNNYFEFIYNYIFLNL